jgi:hypothetical protein
VETSGGRIGRGGRFDRASPHRKRARPLEPVRLPPNYRELSAGQAHDPRPAPRLHNPLQRGVGEVPPTHLVVLPGCGLQQPTGGLSRAVSIASGRAMELWKSDKRIKVIPLILKVRSVTIGSPEEYRAGAQPSATKRSRLSAMASGKPCFRSPNCTSAWLTKSKRS